MFAGIDWAADEHPVCVIDGHGRVVERSTIEHTADGFERLVRRLARHGDPAELPIAIERPDGRLVDRLLDAGHPLVPVKTTAIKAWREAEVGSGAKSDLRRADLRELPPVTFPWSIAFRVNYRTIRWLDPLIRVVWQAVGIGNVVELRVPGRRTGADRRVLLGLLGLLGLLRVTGRTYLGHPNGDSEWTRSLAAAGEGTLAIRGTEPIRVRPIPLPSGPEREAVIQATSQHPFPGYLLYRLARGHVRAVGVYLRLEPFGREDRWCRDGRTWRSPQRARGDRSTTARKPASDTPARIGTAAVAARGGRSS